MTTRAVRSLWHVLDVARARVARKPTPRVSCALTPDQGDMVDAPNDVEELESETERVARWRALALLNAGYEQETAFRLAAGLEDLHRMVRAKLAGIADDVAERVFL